MPKVLLVTNDFPPTLGGIQSYLRDFLATLPPESVMVFASTQDAKAAEEYDKTLPYPVVRWPRKVMLPTLPTMAKMQELIREHNIETVWFGAAAPLGLMGKAAKAAGAKRVVATTHGHEVGWSMIPGARQCLRAIGNSADVVTYIASYTLGRIKPAFGDHPEFVHLPSGVDVERFQPVDKKPGRERFGWGDDPVVVCISRLVRRKGQDKLISVWPRIRTHFPNARLCIIGGGPYERGLKEHAATAQGFDRYSEAKEAFDASSNPDSLYDGIYFMGKLSDEDLVLALGAADVFAMPCRTRGGGLDVEGLGIVYLEAQAAGIPVVAGNSGGAPEAVSTGTGIVVNGRDLDAIYSAIAELLENKDLATAMGEAGRDWVCENWTWEIMGQRLRDILL
ncbi:MAG: glycosyltransferase family 4 protein [Corynebacterium sp.]|nr:glycosyltransferase family 4 protein [Corynebacterium sp.]